MLAADPSVALSFDVPDPTALFATPNAPAPQPPLPQVGFSVPWYIQVLSAAGGVLGAYHGYKRHNGSIGWAIGWSIVGSLFFPISIPVALAQGIGKPYR